MYDTPFHNKSLSEYRFLITGGAGFIGSNLVEYLLKYGARKVRVLDNLSNGFLKNIEPYMEHPSFEFIEGDIRDLDTCRKAVSEIDFISHQAALGSVPRSIKDPVLTNSVNVDGFLNMLVAAKEEGVRRFVYAASSSTYGDSRQLPKVEENIGKPLSPYAVTKLVNELYADVFYKTYGTEVVGLRYFNIFGPRQDPFGAYAAVIPLFFKAALRNESPVFNGDGLQTRDFTFVENAVQANVKAFFAGKEAVNQVYNIAVGERVNLVQLWENIVGLTGTTAKPVYGPARQGDVRDSLADIGKAKRLLGYSDVVPMKKGLEISAAWYKANL